MTRTLLTHLLALLTFALALACDAPTTRAEPAPLPPPWRHTEDTTSILPPHTAREALRLTYIIPHPLASPPLRGTLDAGSWAERAILNVLHADHPQTPHLALDPALVQQALPDDLRQRLGAPWHGPDHTPLTPDDRPYLSLHDLHQRAQPSPEDLGRLLWLARRSPHLTLDPDPYRWHLASPDLPLNDLQAQALLHTLNTCPQDTLQHHLRLAPALTRKLLDLRPLHTLQPLHGLSGLTRKRLALLALLAPYAPCHPTDERPLDPLVADALHTPALLRLRWLHAPDNLRRLRQRHAQHLTHTLHTLRAQHTPDLLTSQTLRAEAERLAAQHLLRPFDHLTPTPPPSLRDHDLRAATAEHLLHAFSAPHTPHQPSPLPQPWPTLLQQHREDLLRDLAALQQGSPAWSTYDDGHTITLYGHLLGLFCEVTFQKDNRNITRIYIELD